MKNNKSLYVSVVALALVLGVGACAPTPSGSAMKSQLTEAAMAMTPTEGAMMNDTATPEAMMNGTATPEAMMNDTATPEAMMATPGEGAMMATPAWFGTTLTDVTTGKTFSISDFKGKVVLIETIAQSCAACKQQELNIKAFREKLGMPADLVTVSLDVDPNDVASALKTYASDNSFGWIYSLAPTEVSGEIGKLYGGQVLNPASAPLLIIDRKGDTHLLPAGIESADDLLKAVDPYLKAM